MKKYILLLSLSLKVVACKSNKAKTSGGIVIFSLDKKSGRGIVPTYNLKIYDNGKAVFEGIKNTEKLGEYQKQLTEEEMEVLKKAFQEANFFNFEDEYTSMITDLPTTYIMYSEDKRSKRIRDYHGAPASLKELEKLLENIADSEGWKKIEVKD